MIEQTEALTAVDVNSGKMVKKKDSFLKTNLEAAEELVRQIGLRNLSGMIIVDFINLKEKAEEEQLVSALKKYIQQENTGIVYVDMTRLGLVELTRKKNGKTLRELFADGRKEEVYGTTPIVAKDKTGESMPSRHTASFTVIAMTWLYVNPAAGVIMLVLAFLMGVVSVLGGVHFVKDVLAGAGIGVLIGIIGLFLI